MLKIINYGIFFVFWVKKKHYNHSNNPTVVVYYLVVHNRLFQMEWLKIAYKNKMIYKHLKINTYYLT